MSQVIRTYSRRQPTARYESSAALVPAYANPAHVRESRLNDKTLVVDNFDDTFDRLTNGVVVPSPDNSLDGDELAKRRASVVFDIFKAPLQAKKKPKPKEKGKSKKNVASKAAGVKRKKVDVGSDDSGSSDQEETHKKKAVKSGDKKSKEKVKRAVKRRKDLSPGEPVVKDTVALSEIADENVPNNIESNDKQSTKTDDNFKKPKAPSRGKKLKIVDFFQASPPKVDRMQTNADDRSVSPVPMAKNKETEKEASSIESEKGFNAEHQRTVIPVVLQDVPTENTAHNGDNANESFDEIVESSQSNGIDAIDIFAKPKGLPKVHLLKPYSDTLTSTPRMNKIRMPVNIQHLSPILSDKEKRVSVDAKERSSTADVDVENDQNCEGSIINDMVQVSSEQVAETVKSPTKLDEIQHDDIEENLELLSQETIDASQSSQQELLGPNVTNENQDQRTDRINSPESSIVDNQDNLIDPAAVVESNKKELVIGIPVVTPEVPDNTESFVHSPLMFDDSEWIHLEKSDVASENDKVDSIQINFSQKFSEKNEDNDKPTASLESAQVEPAATKNKSIGALNESSFYPHDWSNDYDSTYGYDQHKTNLENDSTVDSKLDEMADKNSTASSEKSNDTSKINQVSTIDNTEIQSVENHELEQTEHTVCDEGNAIEDSKNKLDNQQEHLSTPSISNEDDRVPMNVDKDSSQNSQSIIERSYYMDKSASRVDEPNESMAKMSVDENLDDQSISVPVRPSKRRKTDASEIMIFDEVDDDDTNVQNKEETLVESSKSISVAEHINNESADNASLAKPVEIYEIVQQLPNKELRVILSRVKPEDYKSPILSRKKPVKTKRKSRKSKDTDDDAVSRNKKQEKTTTSDSHRVTRGSVTEGRMQQLYVQHQCKEVIIYLKRLEDEEIELPPRRSLKRKSRENSTAEDSEADSSLTNGGLSDFLSKLNDPVRVAMRRKTQKKYDGHLAAINEDQAGQSCEPEVGKKVVTWGNDKRVTFNECREDSEDDEDNDRVSQPIFLKPGKSWARSLSIINHFHNGKNMDELAAGRESCRHSVQTVLNMQPEVSARKSSQDPEESRRESRVSRASSHRESKSMRKSSIANPRFSMRIIPGGKRSTLTDDLMDSQRISHVSNRSRASRKTSLKIRRDTLIETEDDLIKSAKDIILKRCKQTTYEPFDVCFPDSYTDKCRKIGEGVYGEVFLYENGSEKSVIKIIPIEGSQIVNFEPQKKFHEILSEIIIAEELHKLRHDGEFHTNGFVEVNRIMCVTGKYPAKLIDLWYKYDEKKTSENDCPSMFEKDQLYIVLDLAHGGQDLEAYTFQNASESYAIFLQTALTLAVAEQSLEFEHRDMHWGNLLISKTEDKHSIYKLGSEEISVPTKGVKVAVIDFTLSRMSYQGCKIFNDLAADPSLFDAHGEYQFDIYRLMRDNVNDDWQQFNPFTNVLWMDYTLDKMITQVRYKKKTTKVHKSAIEDMKALRKEIMKYTSAYDFVTNCKRVQALFDST